MCFVNIGQVDSLNCVSAVGKETTDDTHAYVHRTAHSEITSDSQRAVYVSCGIYFYGKISKIAKRLHADSLMWRAVSLIDICQRSAKKSNMTVVSAHGILIYDVT
jgi:hypothetical protein